MKKSLNILTIGNSFADSAIHALVPLVEFAKVKFNVYTANFGGCPLRRHWSYIKAETENPTDCTIYPYRTLAETLRKTPWDIITIQQASAESWRWETFQPYATNIKDFIKKHAPEAEIVIQQTWAYREDHEFFKDGSAWGINQSTMYSKLTENYKRLSSELGNLRIIPTGYAVQLARKFQSLKFRALSAQETESLSYPDIPPQAGALVGKDYYVKDNETGEFVLKFDRSHLNARGEYLQAMVWFGMLFECDVTTLDFTPDYIGKADAEQLRGFAAQAIASADQIPSVC